MPLCSRRCRRVVADPCNTAPDPALPSVSGAEAAVFRVFAIPRWSRCYVRWVLWRCARGCVRA